MSSDFNANRISSAATQLATQSVVRIIRGPGVGLGISIAGGIGSVPFVGDDEVSLHIFLRLFRSNNSCIILNVQIYRFVQILNEFILHSYSNKAGHII